MKFITESQATQLTDRLVEGVLNDTLTSEDIWEAIEEAGGTEDIFERIVKKVSMADKKKGGALVSRQKDRKTRSKKAVQTTGLSKASLRKRARKAGKTLRRKKGSDKRKADKLRKKSNKKRSQMGI